MAYGSAAARFKPHQSRASKAVLLPLIALARASFPAFGEAKEVSAKNAGAIEMEQMTIEVVDFKISNLDQVFYIQRTAYQPLFEKYRDESTNPYMETRETVLRKYTRTGTKGYLILKDKTAVGAVRVALNDKYGRISALCVLPQFQGQGIAQTALLKIDCMHPEIEMWFFDTILEEAGNCRLYEKIEYRKTGKTEKINDKMTLVYYEKRSENG